MLVPRSSPTPLPTRPRLMTRQTGTVSLHSPGARHEQLLYEGLEASTRECAMIHRAGGRVARLSSIVHVKRMQTTRRNESQRTLFASVHGWRHRPGTGAVAGIGCPR